MNSIRSLLAVAAAAVTSSSLALAQGPCVDHGWCHFPPIVPDPATQGPLFGWSLDMRGDTAVVGSLGADTVSVYERVGSDWMLVQILEDPHAGDNQFGANVALSEDFIAVGAHLDDSAGVDAGAVHMFRRENGAWVFDETLTSISPSVDGAFGRAVDVDGIWLAVGAPGEAGGGGLHVYMRTFSWWFRLTGVTTATSGELGASVAVRAIEGETAAQIVAGDPFCDEGGENAGRVSVLNVAPFAYYHNTLLSPVPQAGALFGWDVDIEGSTLVVGGGSASIGGVSSGAVDVFDVGVYDMHPVFDHVQRLTSCSDASSPIDSNTSFGFSVDIDGGRIAVGAPGRDKGTTLGGAVEIFRPNPLGAGFTRDGLAFAEGAASDEHFGWDVALSGNSVLVAAWGNDIAGGNHGAVYPVSLSSKSVVGGACPCDCLAEVRHFGMGKAGTNGVPTIDTLSLPVPGENIVLRISNSFVGAAPIVVWGLVPGAFPFDGGVILIEDLNLEFLPPIGPIGQVGIGWEVPADPATCGLDVYVQAFMFDPGASGVFALAHTDGLHLTVGY